MGGKTARRECDHADRASARRYRQDRDENEKKVDVVLHGEGVVGICLA